MDVSWRSWLRDRHVLAATLALALGAAGVQWLIWWLGPAPRPSVAEGPPRADYVLHDARVSTYGSDGRPSVHLQAPRVDRRAGDESLYVDAPTFQLVGKSPGVPDWHGRSAYGWINHDGTLMRLDGPVELDRAAYDDTPKATIDTADVTVWPRERRLATAAPARMVQGGTKIDGIGLRANLDDKHLELLDDVHATFPPRRR